jgi:hypothetical protein
MNSQSAVATPVWLTYPLVDGFIHDWLAAGPLALPVDDLHKFTGTDYKLQISRSRYRSTSEVNETPLERAAFSPIGAETPLTWRVYRCTDDHFVDLSRFHHTCHHLMAWAFCRVDSPTAQTVTARLTTNAPADLWVNNQHVERVEHLSHQLPATSALSFELAAGENTILVRFEGIAVRECPYVMALKVEGDNLTVALPTTIEPAKRRERLELLMDQSYLDRDVVTRNEEITLYVPEGQTLATRLTARLQRPDGRTYSEHDTKGEKRDKIVLGKAYQFPEDHYRVVLLPDLNDYYVRGLRVDRAYDLYIVGNREYSTGRYGTYQERRAEALRDAAGRKVNVFAEIAKMELGWWDLVDRKPILDTIDMVNSRADCSDFYLVGLLGMVGRYIEDPGFPQDLVDPLKTCFLNFRYWMDEPGSDAMCFWSENHQILFHACEVLVGQLLPDETFTNANMTGEEHRRKGERMALSWLRKRAAGGFREWDSNTYFEEDVLALSHLADLAEDDDVREMATVVLDKLFLSLAINSFKGVFGSTHGRTYTPYIKGGYLEPTSGMGRMLWGKGIFNDRILGTVSLACAVSYLLPPVIEAIALDPAAEIWNRERHAGQMEQWCDLAEGAWEVNKVTYKTPDYMLASAQDYQPGQPGYQQHIWQATMSPEAVVFVTHPPCISEDGSHRPNFWHGNVVLPRAAQWKDALIAIHNLPEDDWLGFTHAYFPTYAFDEYTIRDGWAFARVGDGYLAITASRGIELMRRGKNALRELRSYGHQNIWLVQMGRAAQDGSFEAFQSDVMSNHVRFDGLTVEMETLRGETLSFGWTGPLRVDGVETAITGFAHYDNPYTQTPLNAETMEIGFQDLVVRLKFS